MNPLLRLTCVIACLSCQTFAIVAEENGPLRLHPENPHYFEYQGKPTLLITSGEHYGAVLNPDFHFPTYLDTLQNEGLNLTRAVNGTFVELPYSQFWRGGDQNPLSPRYGRYLAPWARSQTPGYFFGGNKFDLDRWDETYFERLIDFVQAASDRGIIVEFNLFYAMYGEGPVRGGWVLSPLNAANNINGTGKGTWQRYLTLDDPELVERQDALLRKTLVELNRFDNVYYEICDEPYFTGATPEETRLWQWHLIDTFVETEKSLAKKHLIAVNFANGSMLVKDPHPAIAIYNFHYANPPDTVGLNWHHRKPIVFDETEINGGHIASDRRREAWAFMISGGAGYNNLDPSFATDDPTGAGRVQQDDGRYDCRKLRAQLRILKTFLEEFDFIHSQPSPQLLDALPKELPSYLLAKESQSYVAYLMGRDESMTRSFSLELPAGRWKVCFVTPRDGKSTCVEIQHDGGSWKSQTPEFTEDLAIRVDRVESES
jgi:hypothetical protein